MNAESVTSPVDLSTQWAMFVPFHEPEMVVALQQSALCEALRLLVTARASADADQGEHLRQGGAPAFAGSRGTVRLFVELIYAFQVRAFNAQFTSP